MVEVLPVEREDAFWAGVENATRFFMGEADVQRALERLARILDEKGIPYAIVGALALNEWGYRRVTVGIDVLLAGEYPGDGKPKPVAFPDPAEAAVRGQRVALLPLRKLIELKLASGISASHRLKDLADVLELIRALSLPLEMADSLDGWVRAKYHELWQAAQTAERE